MNAASLQSEGGRVVLDQLLRAIVRRADRDWQIIVVVRGAETLPQGPNIAYRAPAGISRGWLGRAWLEFFGLRQMFLGERFDTFLSLQGANARISANRKFVYCHNAVGFEFPRLSDVSRRPRSAALQLAYALAYRFGIGRNATVIVQQEWQRTFFRDRLGLLDCLVAHPLEAGETNAHARRPSQMSTVDIIYPTSAAPHKNTKLLCEAIRMLARDYPGVFHLVLTLDGSENDDSRSLRDCFGSVPEITFTGKLDKSALRQRYHDADLLVFPSLIESWGLPLTEAKEHGLGILAADLPYAHETIGDYGAADFFDPADAVALAERLHAFWTGQRPLRSVRAAAAPTEPFAPHWDALVDVILSRG